MEAAAAWAPCDLQLANWSAEEEPAAGLPVEYASIDIACVPDYYCYSAASQHNVVTSDKKVVKISNDSDAQSMFDEVMGEFEADINMIEKKMHRYPACLGHVDETYTVPRMVAIGPYHHGREHLKQAEIVKHTAACDCVRQSGRLLEELYGKVVRMADYIYDRHFYDKDVMAGINLEDFRHMMFFDTCFLVQFMFWRARGGRVDETMDPSLSRFIYLNRNVLLDDVMLLENQLPMRLTKAVMRFMGFKDNVLEGFVSYIRASLKNHWDEDDDVVLDGYEPPHLLGLVRHHVVESREITTKPSRVEGLPFSVGPIELAEMGIKLSPNKTTKLISISLNDSDELSMSPMSLTHARAIWLVNMAAVELCTIHSKPEKSAVTSYLHLLSMLVHREEDVQELRTRGILAGAGLTNKEALNFFTKFQGLPRPPGSYSSEIMIKIKKYKDENKVPIMWHQFYYKNKKTIWAVFSAVVAVLGLLGTLIGILLQL